MKLDTFVLRLDGNQKFSLHKIANRGCFVSRLSLFIKYFFFVLGEIDLFCIFGLVFL